MNKFTDQEIAFIKANYQNMGYQQIALKLNKSIYAINKKVRKLQLPYKVCDYRFKSSEIDFIKANYDKFSCQKIGNCLNRSAKAIEHQVQKLGLSKKIRKPITKRQTAFILNNHKNYSRKQLAKRLDLNIYQVYNALLRAGIKYKIIKKASVGDIRLRKTDKGRSEYFIKIAENKWEYLSRYTYKQYSTIHEGFVVKVKNRNRPVDDINNLELVLNGKHVITDIWLSAMMVKNNNWLTREDVLKYPAIIKLKKAQLKLTKEIRDVEN